MQAALSAQYEAMPAQFAMISKQLEISHIQRADATTLEVQRSLGCVHSALRSLEVQSRPSCSPGAKHEAIAASHRDG